MITILLLVAAAFQQQPQSPSQPANRPAAAARPTPGAGLPGKAPASTPFDSTVAVISDIGIKVSGMRSGYDVFRLAVFNQSDGAVGERAQQLGAACRAVIASIVTGSKTMCRTCIAGANRQAILAQYRATLPEVQRTAQRCSTRMPAENAAPTAAQIASLRRDVRPIGSQLYQGLLHYENRLNSLRVAMGWTTPPMPTPRRGSR
jgi:hypothetical protein